MVILLPSSKIIVTTMNKVLKAFEDRIQMEVVRVRWEEIKRLSVNRALTQ